MSGMSQEKVMAPLSIKQIHHIHGHYRAHFRKEIDNPSADTNHIINFSLKIENFMAMNSLLNFCLSGATMFGVKTLFGNSIDKFTKNYLG